MKLKVRFSESANKIPITFGETAQRLSASMGEVHTVTEYIGGEKYTGAYEVTPKVEAQRMATKDKVLVDDMTIKAIPFFNVGNTSGGSTVFIGNEV